MPDGIMSRGQLVDALQDRPGSWHVAVAQVMIERQGIEPARYDALGQGQQGLQLAGEDQAPAIVAIDQRLLAQPVAGQDQRAAGCVPDRQREHPAQQREHPRSLVLVEVNEDLGVAAGAQVCPLASSRRRSAGKL